MLLLMDEIFDLKVRNQWLRRRIITLLRQIIRTMFGDIVNRRIVEYVSLLTSPAKVAGYLKLFKLAKFTMLRRLRVTMAYLIPALLQEQLLAERSQSGEETAEGYRDEEQNQGGS